MIKFQYYLFILLPFLGFSQAYEIPKIDFKSKTEEEHSYTELLGLKDENALIVRLAYSILPHMEPESDLIIFYTNGKIRRYRIFESVPSMNSLKRKRIHVKKNKYSEYWQFLNSCADDGKFEIDKSQLATLGEKANLWTKAVIGGQTSTFGLYQSGNYIEYKSFLLSKFTDKEYPGFEEKRKLRYLIEGFQNLLNQ